MFEELGSSFNLSKEASIYLCGTSRSEDTMKTISLVALCGFSIVSGFTIQDGTGRLPALGWSSWVSK